MGASKLFCGCFHHAFLVSRHRNADKLYSDRIEAILSDTPNHVAQISNFSATMVLYQSWQGVNSWIKGPTKENLGLVLFWWRCSILYQILFFGLFKHSWIHIFEVASCYILDSWTPISMTFIKVGSQFWIARLWNFMDPISIVARKTPRFFLRICQFWLVKSYSFLQIQLGRDSKAPFLLVQNQWSPPVRAAGESVGLAVSRAPAGATDLGRARKNLKMKSS